MYSAFFTLSWLSFLHRLRDLIFLCEQGRVVVSVLGHFAPKSIHPAYVMGIPGLYSCHWKEVTVVQGITAALEKGLGFLLVSNMETYLKSLSLYQSDC